MDGELMCTLCQKTFSKKANLTRHQRSGLCQSQKHLCPLCSTSYVQKQLLVQHINEKHPSERKQLQPDLKCPNCTKMFISKANLTRHQRSGSCQSQKHLCPLCSTSYVQKQLLVQHINEKHPSERKQLQPDLKCPNCTKMFISKANLTRHQRSGSCQRQKHLCPLCSTTYVQKQLLVQHINEKHSSERKHLLPDLKCPKCTKIFTSEQMLQYHLTNETCAKGQFSCAVCMQNFCWKKTMLKHMRENHPDQAPEKKPHTLADVEGYQCCGESFANGKEYRIHKDRVHVRKPRADQKFTCMLCDTEFEHKAELIQHGKVHQLDDSDDSEDERPRYYKCPFAGCQQRFQTRSELLKHKWVHRPPIDQDGEMSNNSYCVECEEWFWYEEELKNHRMDAHGLPGSSTTKFQCPYMGCNQTFDTKQEQQDHIKDHYQEAECEPEEQNESHYGLIDDNLLDDADILLQSKSGKGLYTEIGDPIVDRAGQKKFKTVRMRQSVKLTDKARKLCERGLALEVMSKVIDSLFKKTVDKGGYIQIKLISDSLDTPIVMPLIRVKLFDPLVLLNYIESVMSSKDQLALDETLTFDVIHVEDMSGAGRKLDASLLDSYLKRRVGVFDARNWDNRCLGLCLAAWTLIQDAEKFLQAKFYKDPQHSKKLQRLADRLYTEVEVDQEKECGEAELLKFQTHFNQQYGKQIIVLNESFDHQFTGEPVRDEKDQLFLLLFDKHYYLIWDLHAFIGRHKRFCSSCISIYDARSNHLCKDVHSECLRNDCEALKNPDTIIVCDRCDITFKHFECFLAHSGSQRVCMHIRYRCRKCLCIRRVKGVHRCDKKPKCQHCRKEVDLSEHLCQVQIPAEKTRMGPKTFNVVYFDVETATFAEGKLIPYLVCWAINCEKCINMDVENCQICGLRYRHHFGWDCTNKFCDWLATNKRIEMHRTILTAHNSAKFDAYFIYEYAAATGTKPRLNFRANDLLSFTWRKIQLKDSLQFMKCSLEQLPTILGLGGVEKGFFAWRLANDYPSLDYRGPIPPSHYFGIDRLTEEKQRGFHEWYDPLERDPNYIYDFKAEAIKYCNMDVKILESAWKQFRLSCLQLTDNKVDPLIGCYFTLASFSAAIYKTLFMDNPIGIVLYGGYRNPKRVGQSWQGSAYLEFLNGQRVKNGGESLVCANNAVDEVRIGPYKVDGLCRQTGDIYEVLGCFHHAHIEQCQSKLRKAIHPIRKPLTFEDVNIQTVTRLRQLEETGRNVHRIWTCEIVKEMSTNPLLSAFMKDENMLAKYKKPLDPAAAVFGGRVEAFKLKTILTTEQIMRGYSIEYVDFCSLYPFCQWFFEFTTQTHPNVITRRETINRLNLSTFLEENYGLCYCKVVPYQRLPYAVLPYCARDKTVFCLCRTCAEQDICEGCDHDEEERALEGVYTFYELLKSIQRGYKVLYIYEIWNYGPEKAKTMADYVTRMISMKTRHSEFPAEMSGQEFCDLWNQRVPGMNLKPEDLNVSPAMRQTAKILMNSLWGKFCERASKTYTCLVDGWFALKRKLEDKEVTVSRIEQISGRSLVISYQKKDPFLTETSMYNPVLGSYVTAYARITLLEKCLEVVGDRALYTDTDSLMYIRIPGMPEPLRGEALGQLANELKSDEFGVCYQCLAPKTWRLEVCKRTCEVPIIWHPLRTIMKSKGLHLGALGSSIKDSINNRELWNDLLDMRLVYDDESAPRRSMADFYKSLEGYGLPDDMIKPCLESFVQQKWIKDRSSANAPGLIVPQPKLKKDRFTGNLTSDVLARKMIRLRHDKSILLNTEENWPMNINATRPYGFKIV